MDHPVYFAQIREDSWVEKFLVDHFSPQKSVCIGSGGCTAFSLLNENTKSIICVDNNRSQYNLINLKKTGIERFDRDDYFNLLGEVSSSNKKRVELINELIAENSTSETREFIHNNDDLYKFGLNHCGSTERYYRYISKNLTTLFPDLENIFRLETENEYFAFQKKIFDSPQWETALQILLSKSSHLLFFPEFMFAKASENDFSLYFKNQFINEFKKQKMSENYFFSQLLSQKYLYNKANGLPPYLTNDGFNLAKKHIQKIKISNENIVDAIAKESSIDAFFLSNVFDWLTKEQIETLCDNILKVSHKGSIVFFRNLLSSSPLPENFLNHFNIDSELSNKLLNLERSMMYRSITVGIRK